MSPQPWSPERLSRLISLRNQGLSFTEITVELGEGLSRNAVARQIFKLRRYQPGVLTYFGLVGRPRTHVRDAESRAPRCPPKILETEVPIGAPEPSLVNLMDIGRDQCHWPMDGEKYCGLPVLPRRPYCEMHTTKAHVRKMQKQEAKP